MTKEMALLNSQLKWTKYVNSAFPSFIEIYYGIVRIIEGAI